MDETTSSLCPQFCPYNQFIASLKCKPCRAVLNVSIRAIQSNLFSSASQPSNWSATIKTSLTGGIFANAGGAEPYAHNRGHDQLGAIKFQCHYGTKKEAPKIGLEEKGVSVTWRNWWQIGFDDGVELKRRISVLNLLQDNKIQLLLQITSIHSHISKQNKSHDKI